MSVQVEYSGGHVAVWAPPSLGGGRLNGLCGNFDGEPGNDLAANDDTQLAEETGVNGERASVGRG